jgi:hypothetical protein
MSIKRGTIWGAGILLEVLERKSKGRYDQRTFVCTYEQEIVKPVKISVGKFFRGLSRGNLRTI